MLAYPVVAAVLAVIAVLVIGFAGAAVLGFDNITDKLVHAAERDDTSAMTYVVLVITLFVAGYCATLITQVLMGGLVKSADEELQGRDSSFGAGLSASFARLGALLGWAFIQTLVGWLLSAVRGNGSGNNAILAIVRLVAASLLAAAWSLITFFVLPLIILHGLGPIAAIKESTGLLKRTWGARLAGGVRIGGLVLLIGILPGIIFLVAGIIISIMGSTVALGIPLIVIGAVVLVIASILVSTLRAVFSVALLHFAQDGTELGPFTATELSAAVKVKS